VFQESSQYIDAEALFARAEALTQRVIVLDEFALKPLETPGLHSLSAFLAAAARHGFTVTEELDLSKRAAPTIQYFIDRLPRYRQRLLAELGLTDTQVDELIVSGENYVARYGDGTYGYRLLQFNAGTDRVTRLAAELAEVPAAELPDRLRVIVEDLTLAERWDLLHRLGIYHHPESVSGAAATLAETAVLRDALPRLAAEHGVGSVLDIPCGDFHWMQTVAWDVDYTGADVVPELVDANQREYGNSRRRFVVRDVTRDPLPRVDLIHCRDLLIHLSIADCRAALENFVRSGSRLLLTSHFAERTENPEIVSGDFRPVNLLRAPFHFPPPLEIINESSALGDGTFTDRSMALWRLADLADVLAKRGAG
jgi:SAM-dependent methyltransferase